MHNGERETKCNRLYLFFFKIFLYLRCYDFYILNTAYLWIWNQNGLLNLAPHCYGPTSFYRLDAFKRGYPLLFKSFDEALYYLVTTHPSLRKESISIECLNARQERVGAVCQLKNVPYWSESC